MTGARQANRLLCLALCLLLVLPIAAKAEVACTCNQQPCICFLQRDDKSPALVAIIHLLEEQGYLQKNAKYQTAKSATLTEKVEIAIRMFQKDHNLEATGMLDDVTLTLLIWDKMPDESAGISGLVWIPVNGGEKYHSKQDACGMVEPRKITQQNAIALGIESCDRCY